MLLQESNAYLSFNGARRMILAALMLALPASLRADQPAAPAKPGATKPADASMQSTEAAAAQKSPAAAQAAERPKRPLEQELERNEMGKIRFSFEAQPWLDVLSWLAKNLKQTLDWQEMPEGGLNLLTQSSYTVDEARDLLNMHLATRGFTLLRRGEVLSLVKLDKLNPAIVPRADEEELSSRDAHEVVRVSFPLDWLVAEDAVKEFQPMLSPFGKLTPMTATNRLEAMDTVANLREVRALLAREQSRHGEGRLVVEFKLKHVRAEEIIEKLRALVGEQAGRGLPAANRMRPWERMRMDLERAKVQAEIAKTQGGEARKPVRNEPDVHLVVNDQENSILANAPPDKLAVIRQAVQALDVPSSDGKRSSDAVTRMRIYRTKSVDPDSLAEMVGNLIDMGKLESTTKVQADDDSNTLIVYATPADHLAIASLVSQIDEDGRDVRIIKLRDLDPAYALQAIKLLLQRHSGGGRREDQFRIEADLEHSRLLAWVNDSEYDQIKALLAKLGDDQGASVSQGNIRVLNLAGPTAEQAVESVRRIWPHLRTNPLRVQSLQKSEVKKPQGDATRRSSIELRNLKDGRASENRTAASATPQRTAGGAAAARSLAPAVLTVASAVKASGTQAPKVAVVSRRGGTTQDSVRESPLAQSPGGTPAGAASDSSKPAEDQAETSDKTADAEPLDDDEQAEVDPADESEPPGEEAKEDAPSDSNDEITPEASRAGSNTSDARADAVPRSTGRPADIVITESRNGQLIISSKDVDALDALEKLIEQMLPRQADYQVFHLKNASPFAIEMTLKQIFGVDKQTNTSTSGLPGTTRPHLQFVSDVDTGTLLVQNATAEQLEKVRELIELYDQPESQDAELRRETMLYEVQFSRADAVAEVVKEVYRDLLSSNDKTFTRERKEGDSPSRGLGYGANYGSKIPQFKGLLSIGVEENSNTLVVSAPAFLMESVMKLVRQVDERAAGHKMKVLTLNGVGTESLRGFLSQIPGVTTNLTPAGGSGSPAPASPASSAPTTQLMAPQGWRRTLGDGGRSDAPGPRPDGARRSEAIIRRGR